MKRKFLLYSLAAGIAALTFSSYGGGPFQGGAGNRTGSAGSAANCTGSGCHATNSTTTQATVVLTTLTNQPVTKYTPGATYKVTVAGTNSTGLPRFGFQASCVKAAATSVQAGSFAATASNTSVRTAGSLQLVEHNTPIVAASVTGGVATYTASFNWTAPAAGAGTVRFFATLNAVNFNSQSTGDLPNTAAPVDYQQGPAAAVGNLAPALLSVYPNPANGELHVKLADGKAAEFSILDVTGRLAIRQSSLMRNEATIDISRLLPGTYFVMVSENGLQYRASFIKN